MTGIRREGETLWVEGDLLFDSVERIRADGRRLLAEGAKLVDLSGVARVDSAAVALLLDWMRNAPLRIAHLPDSLSGMIQAFQLAPLFADVLVHDSQPAGAESGRDHGQR